MEKKFTDYFNDHIEYPDPTSNENLLPIGVCYNYISSTFLNGWINYVNIIGAELISRYRAYSSNLEEMEKVKKYTFEEMPHFDFSTCLSDDVLILARGKNTDNSSNNQYWFFHYDKDTSDCSIGRFETNDSEQEVIELFKIHAYKASAHGWSKHPGYPTISIPIELFKRGWING